VVEIANEVFGFNGWSTAIKEVTIDFVSSKFLFAGTSMNKYI